jgi:hypothetical protein
VEKRGPRILGKENEHAPKRKYRRVVRKGS